MIYSTRIGGQNGRYVVSRGNSLASMVVVRDMSVPTRPVFSKRMVPVACMKCLHTSKRRMYVRLHGKEVESSQESPEPEQTAGVRYDNVFFWLFLYQSVYDCVSIYP